MNDYSKLPQFRIKGLHRLHEGVFGDAVASVAKVIGPCSDEHAARVVEAVLGPLRIIPPKPANYDPCGHSYFTYEGEWHFCDRDHDGSASAIHHSATHEWYSDEDDDDDRAFDPEEKE